MTTTTRGYGYAHRKARAHWQRIITQGGATCARCGEWITPGSDWHLDHTDDRQGYLGPSHATCNTADGARKTNRIRRAQAGLPLPTITRTSRAW